MSLRTLFAIRRPGTVALACLLSIAQLGTGLGGLLLPLGAHAATKVATKKEAEPTVTLNFVNAEIEGVSRAIAAILDRPIVVDPRVKGTITLYSEQPLTPREAYLNFLAALRGQGFTLVEVAGMLKVVPEAEAKLQTGSVSVGPVTQRGDQVLTQIFRLQYENPNNLVTVLRPLISPNNTINANPSNNTLVITDYADNLQRIAKIIAAMDVPTTTDLDIIPLKHAIASDVASLLQKMGDAPASGVTGAAAPGAGSGMTVLADPRTNSLLVRAPNAAKLANIRSLVDKLDRPGLGGIAGSGIYVVYLKNADATKLAQVLRASFSNEARNAAGGSSGGGGSSSPVGGASLGSPNAGMSSTSNSSSASGSAASPQATAPVQGSAAPVTGGYIQADPATNSLIITTTEAQYRQLRAVIDQLDGRRAQVYVETMIVKIEADKVDDIGVQWQGLLGQNGDKNGLAMGTNFNGNGGNIATITKNQFTGKTTDVSIGAGLNIGLIHAFGGTYALGALANFLSTTNDANILSTPNVVAMDNEEAKIVVGKNVPFITGQYTSNNSSSGSVNPFQTVERKDVGLTLRLKPQIGEDGTVRMTIFQENSDVIPGTEKDAAGLQTDKASVETSVVVNDGQVIVLGGLIRDELGNTQSKVPWLGDLPYLGGLFRNESRTHKKQNLMVFLRPVVIRTQEISNAITTNRYDLIRSNQQTSQPESRWLGNDRDIPVFQPRPDDPRKLPLSGTTTPLNLPFTPVPVPAAPGNPVSTPPTVQSQPLPTGPAAKPPAVPASAPN